MYIFIRKYFRVATYTFVSFKSDRNFYHLTYVQTLTYFCERLLLIKNLNLLSKTFITVTS